MTDELVDDGIPTGLDHYRVGQLERRVGALEKGQGEILKGQNRTAWTLVALAFTIAGSTATALLVLPHG